MSAPSAKGGTLPWCPSCECFAVPTDEGNCGDCGSSVVITDGGEQTTDVPDRTAEMFDEVMTEVEGADPDEAELYARCSAAFEKAVNDRDLPPENALGVMMAAVLEGARQAGYDKTDVVETMREVTFPGGEEQ